MNSNSDFTFFTKPSRKMSEETSDCFWDQFYDASQYIDGTNHFQVEEDVVSKISFQGLQMASADEAYHNDFEYFQKIISVEHFFIPKFEMRLTANQGNLKQLASILSVKRTTTRRCIRPKSD